MALRAIDQHLFVTEDGRMLYASGATGFLIPETDIPLLVRTRGRLAAAAGVISIAGMLATIVMNLKVRLSFVLWTVLFCVVALAYSAVLQSWVRRRFTPVMDQPIVDEIRELKGAGPGALSAKFAGNLGALTVLEYFHTTGVHDGWLSVAVVLLVIVLTGVQSAVAENQQARIRARISTSITR